MLVENHVMQVLSIKKKFHSMKKSCYARVFYEEHVHEIEIMLWKFIWNYQKHHVMGNHVMEGSC